VGPALQVTNTYFSSDIAVADAHLVEPWNGPGPVSSSVRGGPRIESIELLDPHRNPVREAHAGAALSVRTRIHNPRCEELVLVVSISRTDGVVCFAPTRRLCAGTERFRVADVSLHLDEPPLLAGNYVVQAWLLDRDRRTRHDRAHVDRPLLVGNTRIEPGMLRHPHRWQVSITCDRPHPLGQHADAP
jgi:hypothetical protein